MALPTPERVARAGTEHAHQTALFLWAKLNAEQWPDLAKFYAIPNGGSRGDGAQSRQREGGRMKAEGVRPGVPDTKLPVARGGYFGLYIEMKRKDGGRLSEDQVKVIAEFREDGYAVAVCHGWEAARDCLLQYIALPKTQSLPVSWLTEPGDDANLKA